MKILFGNNHFSFFRFTLSTLLLISLLGCGSNERVDYTGSLSNEIRSSKIKRITNAELTAALHRTGQDITEKASELLEKELSTAGKNCRSTPPLGTLELDKLVPHTEIRLLYASDSSDTSLFSKEKELLSAYNYEVSRGAEIIDNLQKINDTISIYYAPVARTSTLFTACEEARNSPFVVWRITLNHRDVIKNLD